jgi:putative PEP-CTERM system TPR-repeat lipoprotein
MGPHIPSRIFLLTAFAIVIALASGCGEIEMSEQEHLQRAKQFAETGQWRASIIELKSALQQNPENAEARWLLGKSYLQSGDGVSAEKELKRARELGIDEKLLVVPLGQALLLQKQFVRVLDEVTNSTDMPMEDKARLHTLRGSAYLGQGKLMEAGEEFRLAGEIKPDLEDAQVGQARLAISKGDPKAARKWLDQALAKDRKNAEAWILLGDVEYSEGKFKEAENAYREAIEHGPNNAMPRLRRALVRIVLKDLEGAHDDIQALKSSTPRLPAVNYASGLLHFQQKRYVEAQAALEETLRQAPEFMPAVFYLGATHYAQEHWEQAEQYLTRFWNAFPGSDEAGKLLGTVRLRKGDLAGAAAALEPILARDPDDPLTLNLLANVYLRRGQTEEGIEYLQKVVALQPQSASSRAQLGLSLMMEGDRDKGIKQLETAIELDPQLQQAELMLILSHLQNREFDKALEATEKFRTRQPKSPLPFSLSGIAYLGKGDEAKAREAFDQALQLAPGDPNSSYNLAALEMRKGAIDSAKALYQEVLKHHPGHVRTLLQLANLEAGQGKMQQAKVYLEEAMRAHPKALEPRTALARYYLHQGQPIQALSLLQEIQDLYPDTPGWLAMMGEAQLANRNPERALNAFQKLAQAQPKSAQAHYLLARTYAEMNDAQKLREELNEALALEPQHFPSKVALTRLLMQEKRTQEANKLFQELKQAHPENPEVIALEGWLALGQGRPQAAVEVFKKALKRAPTGQLTVYLALAQQQAGDDQASIATLEDWLTQHPDDLLVRYNLANLYLGLNRTEQAKSAFARVIEQAPDHVIALNNLAWLLRKEDPAKAVKYGERALELAPAMPAVMDTLGTLLLDQGQTERALRLFQQASEKAPEHLEIRYHLAQALAQSGDKEQARKILKEVLAVQKPFTEKQGAEALLQSLGG